ncbi:hypothetical protein [Pseudomonas sp. MWU13-2105]|uniref:hypothetical protein n=1 Tax=Pseudomonas sp. MWU13-2105 TaxID=2935074 RepID=UPI00200E8137|nr:hypothetical protein [Pseudomonas sp. MWU13-2105]
MKRQDCVSCGTNNVMHWFEGRDFEVDLKALRKSVLGLSGWQCEACSEIELAPESAQRYSDASDELIYQSRRPLDRHPLT